MELKQLGWRDFFEREFKKYKQHGLLPGRVAIENKHSYTLFTENGALEGIVPGKLLHKKTSIAELPKVGDWVVFRPISVRSVYEDKQPGKEKTKKQEGLEKSDFTDDKVIIESVLPRFSKITRKVPGKEHEEQILAANVDTAFIVHAYDQGVNLRRLERYLVMVHEGGVKPVILLNKVDLADNPEKTANEVRQIAGDTPVLIVSAKKLIGINELKKFIGNGETVVFIGPSGAGKSSLINALYGEEIQATIEVRESDGKGRHTTTWREMIILPDGGLVIDTPGMREFHMWLADEGIQDSFPEIFEIGVNCKFRDCSHTVEKGCAVLEAVEKGIISKERHQSYVKLYEEIRYLNEEIKKHTYMMKKRRRRPQLHEKMDDSEE